jgi:hypothetical protein
LRRKVTRVHDPHGLIASPHEQHLSPSGPDHVEPTYGLRNSSTGTVLTVGPDNWVGTPMMLHPDYAVSWQRFWLDWRYTG